MTARPNDACRPITRADVDRLEDATFDDLVIEVGTDGLGLLHLPRDEFNRIVRRRPLEALALLGLLPLTDAHLERLWELLPDDVHTTFMAALLDVEADEFAAVPDDDRAAFAVERLGIAPSDYLRLPSVGQRDYLCQLLRGERPAIAWSAATNVHPLAPLN